MLLLTVAVGDDLEQELGAVDVDGQVPELVDDEQVGLADGLELPVRDCRLPPCPQRGDGFGHTASMPGIRRQPTFQTPLGRIF